MDIQTKALFLKAIQDYPAEIIAELDRQIDAADSQSVLYQHNKQFNAWLENWAAGEGLRPQEGGLL